MDARTAKLELARKKLKDHQEKKSNTTQNSYSHESLHDTKKDDLIYIDNNISSNYNSQNDNSDLLENLNAGSCTNPTKCEETVPSSNPEMNVTEILISNKRNLELQINDLQKKNAESDKNYILLLNNYNEANEKIKYLENELKHLNARNFDISKQLVTKDNTIEELIQMKTSMVEENTNLLEQLELTKSLLKAKEVDNDSMQNQLYNLHNQLDATQLKLQQLSSGSNTAFSNDLKENKQDIEILLQKNSTLEQQLKAFLKEKEHLSVHYENYVSELSNNLKKVAKKNEEMSKELEILSNRENSLIDQISDMEIRLQSYINNTKVITENNNLTDKFKDLQQKYELVQEQLLQMSKNYEDLQETYLESKNKVEELLNMNQTKCESEDNDLSIKKLNADITSDKIAAQRATEQNKKLKIDIQELEGAFVKMSKDKLELTEKITAEKYLNRELTIKLAEFEEKAKDMQVKLKAKDEEMIRLQTSYRELEKQYEIYCTEHSNTPIVTEGETTVTKECSDDNGLNNESKMLKCLENHQPTLEEVRSKLPKEDAMIKLQDRFMKIMGEVADLSDEKHRLEHIILQLQNETDTICEYVALYQQQRSLLKKRDEERGAQLKVFQLECDRLQSHLNELTAVLTTFAEDKDLSSYFTIESKKINIEKALSLLLNLKNNPLVDPTKHRAEFKHFYPCNCCSGKLIDV